MFLEGLFKSQKFTGKLYYKNTDKVLYEGELKKGRWQFRYGDVKGYGIPDGKGQLYEDFCFVEGGVAYNFRDGKIGAFSINDEIIFIDYCICYAFIKDVIKKGIMRECEEIRIEFKKKSKKGIVLMRSKTLIDTYKKSEKLKEYIISLKDSNGENIELTEYTSINLESYNSIINFFRSVLGENEKNIEKKVKILSLFEDKEVIITLLDGDEKDKINIKL